MENAVQVRTPFAFLCLFCTEFLNKRLTLSAWRQGVGDSTPLEGHLLGAFSMLQLQLLKLYRGTKHFPTSQ